MIYRNTNINYLLGAGSGFEDFKTALGNQESGNNYQVVNPYGYMGRYQFGAARLNELQRKYNLTPWVSKNNFTSNPALQEQYFLKHVSDHAQFLSPYLAQAQTSRGSWLTLSGLIAFAHLLGAGAARSWARGGSDGTDGNGVHGSAYARRFSGFSIPNYFEDPAWGATHTGTTDPVNESSFIPGSNELAAAAESLFNNSGTGTSWSTIGLIALGGVGLILLMNK